MAQLQAMITELVAEVKRMCASTRCARQRGARVPLRVHDAAARPVAKTREGLYNDKADTFDMSKIPDIYDCIKYDLVHNSHLTHKGQNEPFRLARELARLVVSQEYGMTSEEKLNIGTKMHRTT
jgi:hypothetical protein